MSILQKEAPLWGSRFRKELDERAKRFSSSIAIDKDLYKEDIAGSIAHVEMLSRMHIIPEVDSIAIVRALREIEEEIENGQLVFSEDEEDIHLAIEKRLIDKIGDSGGKVHTARSRNDQVTLDTRLFLRKQILGIKEELRHLQISLLAKASENIDVIMPGYTHMQQAQPILLAHHLLAYVSMFERDHGRLSDCLERASYSPLGAAALAGTSFPIDRGVTARALGFEGVITNSIDAVSDRDHLIEFVSDCSIVMMHLSRIAEELILWSTKEFGFIEMDDSVTTGSSIMPQKKNPDMAELVRGKTGRVYGDLINLLTIMKGLPLAYNRDMQEDKTPLFDAAETTKDSLEIMALVVERTSFNSEAMKRGFESGELLATEMADYLVCKGLSFRNAHHIAGAVVAHCAEKEIPLQELSFDVLSSFSPLFGKDIAEVLDPMKSITLKRSEGSTSKDSVLSQIEHFKKILL
jgi:argininosuccinate lyase